MKTDLCKKLAALASCVALVGCPVAIAGCSAATSSPTAEAATEETLSAVVPADIQDIAASEVESGALANLTGVDFVTELEIVADDDAQTVQVIATVLPGTTVEDGMEIGNGIAYLISQASTVEKNGEVAPEVEFAAHAGTAQDPTSVDLEEGTGPGVLYDVWSLLIRVDDGENGVDLDGMIEPGFSIVMWE